MKRLICLILALLMTLLLIPAAVAEEKVVLRIENGTGNVGDIVSVAVKVENSPSCAGSQFYIVYDNTVLEPVACTSGNINGLFMSNLEKTYDGKSAVGVVIAQDSGAFSGDVTLCTVSFRILAETEGDYGTELKAKVQVYSGATQDAGIYNLSFDKIINGRILVGDDVGITTADAVLIMRSLVGEDVQVNTEQLDQNEDGILTIADAVLLLRLLNGTY